MFNKMLLNDNISGPFLDLIRKISGEKIPPDQGHFGNIQYLKG